jgi:hypothetical protein
MEIAKVELLKIEELVEAQAQLQAEELASLQLAMPFTGMAEFTFN